MCDKYIKCNHKNHDELYSKSRDSTRFFILFGKKEINKLEDLEHFVNYVNNINSKQLQLIYADDDETFADPFLFEYNNEMYVFFERVNKIRTDCGYVTGTGEIYFTKIKYEDGIYSHTVPELALKCDHHLSYPQIFKINDKIYMMPEQSKTERVDLYECQSFPNNWQFKKTLLRGAFVDSTLIYHNDTYWIITTRKEPKRYVSHEIYCTSDILGEWKRLDSHTIRQRKYPNGRYKRCGGGIIKINDELYFPVQYSENYYGEALQIYKLDLSLESRSEKLICTIRRNVYHLSVSNGWFVIDSNTEKNYFMKKNFVKL